MAMPQIWDFLRSIYNFFREHKLYMKMLTSNDGTFYSDLRHFYNFYKITIIDIVTVNTKRVILICRINVSISCTTITDPFTTAICTVSINFPRKYVLKISYFCKTPVKVRY